MSTRFLTASSEKGMEGGVTWCGVRESRDMLTKLLVTVLPCLGNA